MNKLLTFFCLCSISNWGIAQTITGKRYTQLEEKRKPNRQYFNTGKHPQRTTIH